MITKESLLELMATEVAEGKFVDADGAVLASGAAAGYGVVARSDDPDGYSTVALHGYPGVVEVKLHSAAGTVNKGTMLVLHTDGTCKADPGSGARVVCAQALEAGANSVLVKARLLSTPLVYGS